MAISTSEITSASIASDNPIHQRLLYAYEKASSMLSGNLLELGCGQGRGLEMLLERCDSYTGIDRNIQVINSLKQKYPSHTFVCDNIPPFRNMPDDHFDGVATFQVIEHIEQDKFFIDEICRVLKPGGIAIISTPNIRMSLTRNPWHVREYTSEELIELVGRKFKHVELFGVYGDTKVDAYYQRNREAVKKITRFDVLNMQYWLPRSVLQVPYDILNRINRNRLSKNNDQLVAEITTTNFALKPADDKCYDFFCVARKT